MQLEERERQVSGSLEYKINAVVEWYIRYSRIEANWGSKKNLCRGSLNSAERERLCGL